MEQVDITLYPISSREPCNFIRNVVDQNQINNNISLPKDTLFMGTVGRITAYDLSPSFDSSNSIDRVLPIKWTQKVYETSLSGKFHNTAFCLHWDRPIIFSAFNGTITAMSADHGEVMWQARPSKANGLLSNDLGTISLSPLIPDRIFYGCNGHGFCLDIQTGKILWDTALKNTGWNNVAMVIFSSDMVVMGSQGACYALEPHTGKVLWENNLEGTGYGDLTFGKYTINTHGSFSENLLFAGTSGFILSINPKTGETKHKLNLKGTGYNCVSILVDQENHSLFAVSTGKCFCIQPESLRIVWKNDMSGMGVLYGQSIGDLGDYIYVGTFGKVMCMNKKMGTTVWTTSLPGCGYEMVTVEIQGTKLLVGSNGKLYELNTKNGNVLWRDNLKGYSYSQIYLGGYDTYSCTDHNTTTIVQYIAQRRRNNSSH